jgi:hypothetical protein
LDETCFNFRMLHVVKYAYSNIKSSCDDNLNVMRKTYFWMKFYKAGTLKL